MDLELNQQIRDHARKLLLDRDVKCVIGYERSSNGIISRPFFSYDESTVDQLIFDETCNQNLVRYLKNKKEERVAIIIKPCDSRAINLLLNEKQIDRDLVYIIGVSCPGVIDTEWDHKGETLQSRCQTCQLKKPLLFDILIEGSSIEQGKIESFSDISSMEDKNIANRKEFWKEHYDNCIRCYACRQICPGCYCPICFVDQINPQWVGIKIAPEENEIWHIIRAFHLAGRCIGCNECERACPVGIPLSLINRKLEKDVMELFDYKAGYDPEEKPPFATFNKDDFNKDDKVGSEI